MENGSKSVFSPPASGLWIQYITEGQASYGVKTTFFFTSYMFGIRHSGWAGPAITSAVTWRHRSLGLEYDGEEFHSLN